MDRKNLREFIRRRIRFIWAKYPGHIRTLTNPEDVRKLSEVIEDKLGQLRWTNYTKEHMTNSLNGWVDAYATKQLEKRGFLKSTDAQSKVG